MHHAYIFTVDSGLPSPLEAFYMLLLSKVCLPQLPSPAPVIPTKLTTVQGSRVPASTSSDPSAGMPRCPQVLAAPATGSFRVACYSVEDPLH